MTKYKYSRIEIADRAAKMDYTWGQLGKDLFAKAPTKQGNDGGLVCPDCLVEHCQHCKCNKCRKQGKKVKKIELPELPEKTPVTEYARKQAVNNLSLSDRVNFADKMNSLIDWATAVTSLLKNK